VVEASPTSYSSPSPAPIIRLSRLTVTAAVSGQTEHSRACQPAVAVVLEIPSHSKKLTTQKKKFSARASVLAVC
jgi:hypothetical protein